MIPILFLTLLCARITQGKPATFVQILFPPLSCLEVIGEPHVEEGVIVIPLRVNMCLKGLTLEQLVERRKDLHLAMVANVGEELALEAPATLTHEEDLAAEATAVRRVVQGG